MKEKRTSSRRSSKQMVEANSILASMTRRKKEPLSGPTAPHLITQTGGKMSQITGAAAKTVLTPTLVQPTDGMTSHALTQKSSSVR